MKIIKPLCSGRFSLDLLFLFLASVYFASHYPISNSKDGSHYALVRAIAEEGRFIIDTFQSYTANVDFAYRDGHYYSDRAPGIAFLSVPLHLVGLAIGHQIAEDPDLFSRHFIHIGPSIAGALAVILFIRLLQLIGVSTFAAWITGLVYALGSMHWKMSSLFWSHSYTALWTIAICFLIVKSETTDEASEQHPYLLAALLGFYPLLRYECSLLLLGFLVLIWKRPGYAALRKSFRDNIVAVLLFAFIPIALLAYYHTVCFGAPWQTFRPYHNPMHGANHEWGSMLAGNWREGIPALLFRFPGAYPFGVFAMSPVLFLTIPGWISLFRKRPAETIFFLYSIGVLLNLFGRYFAFGGGSSGDPRYLCPALWMFFVPLAYVVDSSRRSSKQITQAIFAAVFAFLAVAGVGICFVHFSQFMGHDLSFQRDLVEHPSLVAKENIMGVVSRVFVGAPTLLPFVFCLSIILLIFRGLRFMPAQLPFLSSVLVDLCNGFVRAAKTFSIGILVLLLILTSRTMILQPYEVLEPIYSLIDRYKFSPSICEENFGEFSGLPFFENGTLQFKRESISALPVSIKVPASAAARLHGELENLLPTMQSLRFHIDADDEFLLLVDGRSVGEHRGMTVGPTEVQVDLAPGKHTIELRYTNLLFDGHLVFSAEGEALSRNEIKISCNQKVNALCESVIEVDSFLDLYSSLTNRDPAVEKVDLPYSQQISVPVVKHLFAAVDLGERELTTLRAIVDDELIVKIDGVEVMALRGPHGPTPIQSPLVLEPGVHHLSIWYSNNANLGVLNLSHARGVWRTVPWECETDPRSRARK